jgi:putative inorganic carbon (hco3(-)) transporter
MFTGDACVSAEPAKSPPTVGAPYAGRAFGRRLRWTAGSVNESASSGFAFGLFIVLIIFTLLSVPSRVPIIGMVRPTVLLVSIISLVIIATSGPRKHRDTSNTTRWLTLFIVYVLVTIPFVQWPGSVLRFGIEGFVKAAVFFFFAVQLVDNFRRLWIFVMTILACQVFRVLEPLYLHVTTGYWGSHAYMGSGEFMNRLSGAPGDIINPNGLAFVVLTALPFLHYLFGGSPRVLLKALYIVLAPLLLYAFLLTGSRSGMVGLLIVAGVIVAKSRHRFVLGVIAVVGSAFLLGTLSLDMKDRYLSLVDSTAQHGATREGRIESVKTEMRVGLERPIFGHGLGTSREALFNVSRRDKIAHNLYTEVFIETGIVGLLLFLLVLRSILGNVQRVRPAVDRLANAVRRGTNESIGVRLGFYQRLADATFVWVVMCLVFSLASYGLSEFYWYMIAGLSVCLVRVVMLEEAALAPSGATDLRPLGIEGAT